MPVVYVLKHDHDHGVDIHVHLSDEALTRDLRELLFETAQEEWSRLDDPGDTDAFVGIRRFLDDEGDVYVDGLDVMTLTNDEASLMAELVASGEREWFDDWQVGFSDDEFRRFLFDNLDAFDVGLITELNARIVARETS